MSGDISGTPIPYRKLGYFPYFVGYCDNERAWLREMKRIKINDPNRFECRGATTHGFRDRDGYHLSIVAVNRAAYRKRSVAEQVGMLAHEAVHVASNMNELIGERQPSEEFYAYTVETVTRWLWEQWTSKAGA